MIIDAHTHLGRPGGALDGRRAVDLVRSMDKAKIDRSMVFAGRMMSISTEQVLDEIKPFGDRLSCIASFSKEDSANQHHWMDHRSDQMCRLEEALASGLIRGLKFYPGYEPFYPQDPWLRPLLELAQKYSRPAIFHSGDTYRHAKGARLKFAMPIHIDELCADMPNLIVSIAHFGYPWQREAGEVVAKNENVYCDCSGLFYGTGDDEAFTNARDVWDEFRKIGGVESESRVLFGSDWPICDQSSYLEFVERAMPQARGLMHGNAEKLFGFAPAAS